MGKRNGGMVSVADFLRRIRSVFALRRISSGALITAVCMVTASALIITAGIAYLFKSDSKRTENAALEDGTKTVTDGGGQERHVMTAPEYAGGVDVSMEMLENLKERVNDTDALIRTLHEGADKTGSDELKAELDALLVLFETIGADIESATESLRSLDRIAADRDASAAGREMASFFKEFTKILEETSEADAAIIRTGIALKEDSDGYGVTGAEAGEIMSRLKTLIDARPVTVPDGMEEKLNEAFLNGKTEIGRIKSGRANGGSESESPGLNGEELVKRIEKLGYELSALTKERSSLVSEVRERSVKKPVYVEMPAAPKRINVIHRVDPASLSYRDVFEFQKNTPSTLRTRIDGKQFSLLHDIAFWHQNNFSYSGGMYQQLKYYRRWRAEQIGMTLWEYEDMLEEITGGLINFSRFRIKEPSEDEASEEAPPEEAPPEETPSEEVPAEDIPTEEIPSEEAPAEEIPAEEILSEAMPSEEDPLGGNPVEGEQSGAPLGEGGQADNEGDAKAGEVTGEGSEETAREEEPLGAVPAEDTDKENGNGNENGNDTINTGGENNEVGEELFEGT